MPDIVITPNRGSSTNNPKIDFTGITAGTIKLEVLSDGTITWNGASGSLFSITDSLLGSLMSVNDISGLPLLEVFSDNRVIVGQFGARLGIGTVNPSSSAKLHIAGLNTAPPNVFLQTTNSAANGGIFWRNNTNTTTSAIASNYNISDASGNIEFLTGGTTTRMSITSGGLIKMTDTTDVTAADTGALQVKGGIYVAKSALFGSTTINGNLNVTPTWNDAGTNFNALNISVTETAAGASSNLLRVFGLYGNGMTVNKFGQTTITSNLVINNQNGYLTSLSVSSGKILFQDTTDTTTANTGALQVSGGAYVAKNILSGANVTANDFIFGTSGSSVKSLLSAHAPKQGLVFDGTAGASFTEQNTSTSHTVRFVFNSTFDTTGRRYVAWKSASYGMGISSSGEGRKLFVEGSIFALGNTSLVAGKNYDCVFVYNGSTVTFYLNGIADGTTAAITTNNISRILETNQSGSVSGFLIYNRALSASEVVALYEAGAPAGADYPPQVAGTALLTGDSSTFTSGVGIWLELNGGSIAASGGVGVISGMASVYDGVQTPNISPYLRKGYRYRLTVTTSAYVGGTYIAYGDGAGVTYGVLYAGTSTVEFTAQNSTTFILFRGGGGCTSVSIDNVTLVPLGLLLAPDAAQMGGGLTWYDTSGNGSNISWTSGVQWSVPTSGKIATTLQVNGTGTSSFAGPIKLTYGSELSPTDYGLFASNTNQLVLRSAGQIYLMSSAGTGGNFNLSQSLTTIDTQNLSINNNVSASPSLTIASGVFNILNDGLPEMTGGLQFGIYPNSPYTLWMQGVLSTASALSLSINPLGGNVLIGTGTDSGQKLQVAGDATFTGTIVSTSGFRTIGSTKGFTAWLDSTPTKASRFIVNASGDAVIGVFNGTIWTASLSINNTTSDATFSGNLTSGLASVTVAGALSAYTTYSANSVGSVFIGQSGGADQLATGAASGDAVFRSVQKIFLSTGGATPALTLDTSGNQTTRGNLTVSGGLVTLNNATSNLIYYNTNGVAAPTANTRSAGTKIVLYDGLSVSTVDYAIGINAGTFWNSVPSTTQTFSWYGGTAAAMSLSGSGNLTVSVNINAGGNITVSGGTITGGTSGLSLASGGTNQNITLTPSGTGRTNAYGSVPSSTWSGASDADASFNAGLVVGPRGTGSSFGVSTASASGAYPSGLLIDGSYTAFASTVNIKAVGVYSGGGYGASLAFHTSNNTTLSEVGRFTKAGNFLIGTTTDMAGSGGLKIAGTTATSNLSTGALIVAGGVGVSGDVNAANFGIQGNGAIVNISNGGFIKFVSDGSISLRSQGGGNDQVTIPQAGGLATTGKLTVGSTLSAKFEFSPSYTGDGVWSANARPSTFSGYNPNSALLIGYADDGGGSYYPSIGFKCSGDAFAATAAIIGSRYRTTAGVLDSADRFQIQTAGKILWGSGSAAQDVSLYRSATGTLAVTGNLTISGTLASTSTGWNTFAGSIATTGANSLQQASTSIIDHASGFRAIGYGANTSTPAGFSFIGLSSDGSVGGTRFSIDSSGNSTFAGSITVNSTPITLSASGTVQFVINSTNSGSKEIVFKNAGSVVGYVWNNSGYTAIGGGSEATSLYVTSATGNVGIGIYNPSYKLQVVGDAKITGSLTVDDGTESTATFGLKTYTKSLQIGTTWLDTGISGTDLATGSYIIQVYVNNYSVNGGQYFEAYTGVMSWYQLTTNSTEYDEIVLHKAGHAPSGNWINLRTLRQANPGTLKLQIISNVATNAATNYVFKFRRLV